MRSSWWRSLGLACLGVAVGFGALLAVAGAYVAYYGWYEIASNRGIDAPSGPVAFVTGVSGDVSTWVQDAGAVRIGLVADAVVALVLIVAGRRRAGRSGARHPPIGSGRASPRVGRRT